MGKKICRLFRNLFIAIVNSFLRGTHFFALKRILLRIAGFQIGKNARIVGPLFCTADLSVGENTFIGHGFSAFGNGKVIIGANCDIAPEVALLTGSHEFGSADHRAGRGISFVISLEDGCWIGARTTITGNTTIHKGAVIGCCSVVLHDIESNILAAGDPAVMIRQLDS